MVTCAARFSARDISVLRPNSTHGMTLFLILSPHLQMPRSIVSDSSGGCPKHALPCWCIRLGLRVARSTIVHGHARMRCLCCAERQNPTQIRMVRNRVQQHTHTHTHTHTQRSTTRTACACNHSVCLDSIANTCSARNSDAR